MVKLAFPKPTKKIKVKKFLKRTAIKASRKHNSPSKIAKDKAWKAFSKYIRLRDCLKTTKSIDFGTCYTCDVVKPFKLLDAGHFIGGRSNSVLFDERGVNAQCKRCNKWLKGNPVIYEVKLIKEFGQELVDELKEEKFITVIYTLSDYIELEKFYILKFEKLAGDFNYLT